MRKLATEWLGTLGLALTIGIGAAVAQTMPSAGINAVDQAVSDTPSPSLSPVTGVTLGTPIGSELLREVDSDQAAPSDGLRLQFYGTRSPAPSMSGENDLGAQGSQNP